MGLVHHTNIVTDGLVSYWDAGNRRSYPGAGTTWTDLAGGQNGTMENMDTGGFDSQKGGVIEFDGTDEYVDMGSSNQILPGGRNPFTISLWLNPEAATHPDYTEGLYSFYQPDDDQEGSTTYAFGIFWEPSASGNTYAFYCGQRGLTTWGPPKTSGASREDWVGKWCCITITYNGEGTKSGNTYYRFYINDVNYALSDIGGWGGTVNFNRLGNTTASPSHAYIGDMANISIYNRALSADEVSQNYEATKPRFEPRIAKEGLVGYWDAGDPQSYNGGTTWKDTANKNNGTFDNNGTNLNFNSANGGYLEFDGTDDSINLGSITSSNPLMCAGGPLSMCIWIYENSGAGENYPYVISKGTGDGNNGYSIIADFQGAIQVAANGQWCRTATGVYSVDEWIYVVGTVDTDGNMRAYVNGVYYANSSFEETGTPPSTTATMRIGARGDANSYWGGSIAQVAIYNALLSDAEIMDNFQKTRGRFGV